ncbi:TIGR01620 family protein [Neomegalonema perideroedes]|uniref:TIGR01620 family protein n=1 Tax=Neomegalonema perideroedes TaxID=217219 RepID=UPI00037358F0|nr:TIGR01620 family protein [Neomegalonema perideroedes]
MTPPPPSDPNGPSDRGARRPEIFPVDPPPAPPPPASPIIERAAGRTAPPSPPPAAPPPPVVEPPPRFEPPPEVFRDVASSRASSRAEVAAKPAPFLLKGEEAPPAPVFSAQDAPQPDSLTPQTEPAAAAASAARMVRGSALSRLFWWAFGGFLTLALSLAAYETIAGLLTRNLWLGRTAMVLLGLAVLALLLMAARELAALSRLRKAEETQILAVRALRHEDRPAAEAALKDLEALAAGRPELAEARERVKALKGDQPDASGLIALAERSYLAGPDASARQAAAEGARSAAVATALIPAGILDAMAILYINLRMIRRIAQSYGGRGGWLGGWRLMKQVAAHLAATGAVALADDLIGPALGGGAVAKLSRRFGEGLLNGALTARVGVAAMEVCRPLPFHVLSKPSARGIAAEGLKGLADRSGGDGAAS